MRLPLEGTVLLSVADQDKAQALPIARQLHKLGFKILATAGTRAFLEKHDIPSELSLKLHEGRPSITDDILNKQVRMIINTPAGRESIYDDGYIRKMAIREKVPYITTLAAAQATIEGIAEMRRSQVKVKSLQEYLRA